MGELSDNENNRYRRLIKKALSSGDFTSLTDIGDKARLGKTVLYPFMKGRSGLSQVSAEHLQPLLEPYNGRSTNGHRGKVGNGHSNGEAEDAAGSDSLEFTQKVVRMLTKLRSNTAKGELRERIDKLFKEWGNEGMQILEDALTGGD